jgi:vitamin B12/bleomycin/antimicrobial peptide transport system ATP-binding/permease protein
MSRPSNPKRFLAARFWQSASGFWRSPGASGARLVTVVLVGSTVLQLALQYRLNYWSRDFFDAFGRRDGSTLRAEALLFLVLTGLSILVALLSVWARMTTQRKWRAWLTRHLIERWLTNDRPRQLHFRNSEEDNSEYRIAEDARVATDAPVSMAAGLLTALLSAVTFIGILWNVGGDLVIEVFGHLLTVPKYLVIAVAIYSALLTLAMTVIGRCMIHVIAEKNAAEAQFRSVASNLRERRAVALMGNGPEQHYLLSEAFNALVGRWRDLCIQMMRTTLVSHGNTLAAPVMAWVLCAPKYLNGAMSLGEAAQAVTAFVVVQTALNWLVDNYSGLAECLSSVNRVASLLLALDELDRDSESRMEDCPDIPDLGAQRRDRACDADGAACDRHVTSTCSWIILHDPPKAAEGRREWEEDSQPRSCWYCRELSGRCAGRGLIADFLEPNLTGGADASRRNQHHLTSAAR